MATGYFALVGTFARQAWTASSADRNGGVGESD